MKRLILFRHAKSSWNHPGLRDFERPLNKRGQRDAPVMAQRLLDLALKPDLIVSSPANRAMITAAVVAEAFGIDPEAIQTESDIYEGTVSDLVGVIRSLRDSASLVIIFGHNPGFTYAANVLTGSQIDNVPTCGVVCIDFPYESWAEVNGDDGELVFFDFPKNNSGPIRPR